MNYNNVHSRWWKHVKHQIAGIVGIPGVIPSQFVGWSVLMNHLSLNGFCLAKSPHPKLALHRFFFVNFGYRVDKIPLRSLDGLDVSRQAWRNVPGLCCARKPPGEQPPPWWLHWCPFPICWLMNRGFFFYPLLRQVNDGRRYTKAARLSLAKGHYWLVDGSSFHQGLVQVVPHSQLSR